jgi:hypothetical protein
VRSLHSRLLACARAVVADAEPEPCSPEAIAAAEALLGRPLPPGYRAFLEEVGRITWPVQIGNVVDFAVEAAPWPAHFMPFADDGGGNLWGFDAQGKRGKELPIEFWDHEEPELVETSDGATKFEAWLEERVVVAESEMRDERRAAMGRRLDVHGCRAWAPDRAQIEEAENALGVSLPEDYRWLTSTFGSLAWPVRIVDAFSLHELTAAMRARCGKKAARAVAFAQEGDGAFVAFDRGGKLVGFGVQRPVPEALLDYLEDRLSHPSPMASVAAPEVEDVELALADSLIRRLVETHQLETTRGFDSDAVARRIADAWAAPARILAILMDRQDVNEVYVSEEDIAALQRELAR